MPCTDKNGLARGVEFEGSTVELARIPANVDPALIAAFVAVKDSLKREAIKDEELLCAAEGRNSSQDPELAGDSAGAGVNDAVAIQDEHLWHELRVFALDLLQGHLIIWRFAEVQKTRDVCEGRGRSVRSMIKEHDLTPETNMEQ